MNGIEKISARIEADARAEIAAIEAEAAQRCEEILSEASAKAEEAYAKRVARGETDCAAKRERLDATADMEMRKSILAFKQELVGETFRKSVEALIKLPEDEYIAFLAAQAAKASSSGHEEMVFAEKDKALASAAVKAANALLRDMGREARLTAAEDYADIPGGLILRRGNIEVNCSADTLVMMQKSRLAGQVAAILFA